MSRPFQLLSAALLVSLASCNYDAGPGDDRINDDSFSSAPPATRVDTERDSVSGGGRAYTPVGTTSGARSVAEAVSSQPGGDPNTSKYTESGTTDGSSTTSGRSLTNRGTTDTETQAVTSGQTTSGRVNTGSGSGATTAGGKAGTTGTGTGTKTEGQNQRQQ